jgi:hypothetical protein
MSLEAGLRISGVWRRALAPGEMLHRQRPGDALLAKVDSGRLPGSRCMRAKEPVAKQALNTALTGRSSRRSSKPLLMIDIDGVLSLFGFSPLAPPNGSFHSIDGIPHLISATAGEHLLRLGDEFELVWASGWEEKANEYLPLLLGLGGELPFLRFERSPGRSNAHWKLDAIEAYAGARPLAWVDDAFNAACHEWSAARSVPTLLVSTTPEHGLTSLEVDLLVSWAAELSESSSEPSTRALRAP